MTFEQGEELILQNTSLIEKIETTNLISAENIRAIENIYVYSRALFQVIGLLIAFLLARYIWKSHIKHWINWSWKVPL